MLRQSDSDINIPHFEHAPKAIIGCRSPVIERDVKKRVAISQQEEGERFRKSRVAQMTYRLQNNLDLWTGQPRSK